VFPAAVLLLMGNGISTLTPSECERSKLFGGLSFLHDMVLLATMAFIFWRWSIIHLGNYRDW
jgi:hypothetical protein